jgi:small conductance mechanosensitive channel
MAADTLIPDAIAPYVPKLIEISLTLLKCGLIFFVGWMASKWTHKLLMRSLERTKIDRAAANFLAGMGQYLILAATAIAVLGTAGIQTTSVIAILGSAGIAVGLALQGNLSHFASGVMILIFRPFTVDDVVTIAGNTGKVKDVGLFATTLFTPANEKIIVPNSAITSNPIINLTGQGTRRGTVRVGVAYGSDLAKVQETLRSAIAATPQILAEPAPVVNFADLGDHALIFDIHAHSETPDYLAMLHNLRSQVYDQLNAADIEIPFWQIVVHGGAGDSSAEGEKVDKVIDSST